MFLPCFGRDFRCVGVNLGLSLSLIAREWFMDPLILQKRHGTLRSLNPFTGLLRHVIPKQLCPYSLFIGSQRSTVWFQLLCIFKCQMPSHCHTQLKDYCLQSVLSIQITMRQQRAPLSSKEIWSAPTSELTRSCVTMFS